MEKEVLFDPITAAEVAERLRLVREHQGAVNVIALTVARMHGAGGEDVVRLNAAGTGVVIVSADAVEAVGPGGSGEPGGKNKSAAKG